MTKVFGLLGLVLAFALVLVGSFPTSAWAMDTALERDILEVIAQHPDAIAHALQSYQQQQARLQQQTQNQVLEQVKQDIPGFIAHSPIRGDKTAKVMLVEFADFQCPFCANSDLAAVSISWIGQRFENNLKPSLSRNFGMALDGFE